MIGIVGTIPEKDFPFLKSIVDLKDNKLFIDGQYIEIYRGTPALIAATIKVCEKFGLEKPYAFLAGDIGKGEGSFKLYEYLSRNLKNHPLDVLTFHYLLPDIDWHNRVLFALEDLEKKPILIADAGYMYVAKMSGEAGFYDLFTPDVGELAFLADEEAPHPFYTRGFILKEENSATDLIARAYKHENSSKYLLVKGERDFIADKHGIIEVISEPTNESMEVIGGTGDTLTGIVTGLVALGLSVKEASIMGAKINRISGELSKPSPVTQIIEIINKIPLAFELV